MDASEKVKQAADSIREALAALDEARTGIARDNPLGRDVSIAITSLEDALLRITVGTLR